MPDERSASELLALITVVLSGLENKVVPIDGLRGLRVGDMHMADNGAAVLKVYTDAADMTISVEASSVTKPS